MSEAPRSAPAGMSARAAATLEYSIIGICLVALILIFQPWALILFSIGCVLVVIGALAFNLVPLAVPGVPARSVWIAALVVLILLVLIVGLAILSAWLYGVYFVTPIGG